MKQTKDKDQNKESSPDGEAKAVDPQAQITPSLATFELGGTKCKPTLRQWRNTSVRTHTERGMTKNEPPQPQYYQVHLQL